ncbi:unnamed protein product [Clonostachys rosea]|uniref:Cellulose-binding protein n=1 Tax=Bionectria ochroleuca TaxID=29856 RepID=A0ABY6UF30_BIOOC|nr:unnamed protein product [Clonostachys rosea]
MSVRGISLLILFLAINACLGAAASPRQCAQRAHSAKPRIFILTDMSNEPDDQMSLVRFLTYSNEIHTAGIAATTSTWLNSSIDIGTIQQVITAYGDVVDNLNANVPKTLAYPSADKLLSKVYTGHLVYGIAALDLDPSDAARALIKAADASKADDPLWVSVWGGATVLAEALNHISKTRNHDQVHKFVSKLRVYSISDQDDAGPWIRLHYPQLSYIVSLHGFNEYAMATWSGISGETRRAFDKGGPDSSLVTNEWLDEHIRIGPLGAHYPVYTVIMEGDTPAFLTLVQNGLGDINHPEWGGWGGRYTLVDRSARSLVYSDATDGAVGLNGDFFLGRFASIWRWREGYQYDFATRMQWTVNGDYSKNNHHPVAVVNETCGPEYVEFLFSNGTSFVLDASSSWDPDGDELTFEWFHYREPTIRLAAGNVSVVSPFLELEPLNQDGSVVRVTPTDTTEMHLLLILRDKREMGLTTYRRIILKHHEEGS